MITSLLIIVALVAAGYAVAPGIERVQEQRQQDQLRVAISRARLAAKLAQERKVAKLIGARLERYDRAAEADRAA